MVTLVAILLVVFTATLTTASMATIYTINGETKPVARTPVARIDHNSQIHSSSYGNAEANVSRNYWSRHNRTVSSDSMTERNNIGMGDDESTNRGEHKPSFGYATSAVVEAALKLGSVLNATSTIEQTYINWVGNANRSMSSTSCWRRAYFAKICPLGYDSKHGMCWSQCPYWYPIQCGLECIRQGDDCTLAIVSKVAVVVQTSLALSAWSVYGDMAKWAKSTQRAVKCTKYMISISKSLVKYIRYIKIYHPETPQDKLLAMLYRIDNVIIDIPVTISYCMGIKVSDNVKLADYILMTAEYTVREIMIRGGGVISSWPAFTEFMKNIALGDWIAALNEAEITSLKSALKSNSTCGYDMKRLLDRTWMTVAELRRINPKLSVDDVRVIMSQSDLVLKDIPIATNNCMNELIEQSDESTAYATRYQLRKTFEVIVDDLIKSGTSNNGSFLSVGEYAVKIADFSIALWAIWDPYYITSVISEYFQPICSRPDLMGEIDDGNVKMALGMLIAEGAFNNSDGVWTRVGNGSVTITFKSLDTVDVTVNIKSGGKKVDEVDVPAGKTVTWNSSVTTLGGKTLYLDRWRPGFLGLPGTGGGSLVLWIPRSTDGGNLQLTAMLNVS